MPGTPNTTPVWVKALLDKDLSAIEYRVWCYLSWRQGGKGSSWPAQDTIAADLGLTAEGVRKITRRLERKGWLRIDQPEKCGRQHRLNYTCLTSQKPPTAVGPSEQKPPTAVGPSEQKPPTAVGGLREETPNSEAEKPPTAKPRHKEEHLQGTLTTKSHLRQVFDHWNSFEKQSVEKPKDGGAPVRIAWESHRLKPDGAVPRDKADAIRRALDDYSVDDICAAITNYATVLLGPRYRWTHAWTLAEFLTRHQQGDRRGLLQYWRFLPDEFSAAKYRKDTTVAAAVVRDADGLTPKQRAEMAVRGKQEVIHAS